MHRARDPIMAASFPLAPGVHRPRRPQPCLDRTRLSVHPKQARYSTDYAQICGTNIMRGTAKPNRTDVAEDLFKNAEKYEDMGDFRNAFKCLLAAAQLG